MFFLNSHEAVFLFPFVSSSPRRATGWPQKFTGWEEEDGNRMEKRVSWEEAQANEGFYAKQETSRSLGGKEINGKEKEELGWGSLTLPPYLDQGWWGFFLFLRRFVVEVVCFVLGVACSITFLRSSGFLVTLAMLNHPCGLLQSSQPDLKISLARTMKSHALQLCLFS